LMDELMSVSPQLCWPTSAGPDVFGRRLHRLASQRVASPRPDGYRRTFELPLRVRDDLHDLLKCLKNKSL
jgi:hypothetical protein